MQRVAELKEPDPADIKQRMRDAYDKFAYFITRARREIGLDRVRGPWRAGADPQTIFEQAVAR
jgi:hypothetical protein